MITQNGEAKGVVMDIDSTQEPQDATLLLKLVAQGEEDILQGRTLPQEDVFESARSRLATR